MKEYNALAVVPVTMSSRDIAELTDKNHSHVMRDIRAMLARLKVDPNLDWHCATETYQDGQGKAREMYRMDKNTTLTLVSGYDAVLRFRIIKRWQELETPEAAATLLPSEQQTLSEIVHHKAATVPPELIGKAKSEIWSRVHHKFRISKYGHLPRTQLTDAILYVNQMELRMAKQTIPNTEAKALPNPDSRYSFPVSVWRTSPQERIGFLTWQDLVNAQSRPLPALLKRLTEDGNDIEGARIEYRAMRHLLEVQHWILEGIARDLAAYPNRGLGVATR
ncbi:MAG TPA: Rha family transcriptional regulator [Candidatus Competibacter sp.]|nr:hypothetical protein [Candidatus Competibacteraceae bacterium]HRE53553.1 Rha family transcriptional regulator [Candidatus Competibacter sp.]HUM93265.1 Rha family transcriptional regulator [Candidatus Competibacter sp.]